MVVRPPCYPVDLLLSSTKDTKTRMVNNSNPKEVQRTNYFKFLRPFPNFGK